MGCIQGGFSPQHSTVFFVVALQVKGRLSDREWKGSVTKWTSLSANGEEQK